MMSLISSQNDRKKEVQEKGEEKNDLIPLLLIKYWNNFLNLLQI